MTHQIAMDKQETLTTLIGNNGVGQTRHEKVERMVEQVVMQKSKDISIPKSSKLPNASNYQVWSFRMLNLLKRHKLFVYCIEPLSS